jgi:hypothetical protein
MRFQPGLLSKAILSISFAVVFAGCGGGGGLQSHDSPSNTPNDPDGQSEDPVLETGVFVDSPVANIGYRTATQEGVTDAEGKFNYVAGETVVFFIGDLEFPAVAAAGVVTPLDIADSEDLDDPVVINIARLLQSIDADGDASNGIQIPAAAAAAAATVDFSLPVEDFAALPAVANLVANSGSVTTSLVDADAAIDHLDGTLQTVNPPSLVGSWVAGEPGGENVVVLTFIDGTRYMIANDEDNSDDTGHDGIEYGSYWFNSVTGVIEVDATTDTNGEWGFSSLCGVATLTFSNNGNSLRLTETGLGCDAPENVEPQFSRVRSSLNPLVGGYFFEAEEETGLSSVVLTILDEEHYVLAENAPADVDGEAGVEHGSYAFPDGGVANRILFEIITDTNGQWGFSHPCGTTTGDLSCGPGGADKTETLVLDGDVLTFTSDEEDQAVLTRVGE